MSEPNWSANVFCHSQVIENQTDIACELSHFLDNATDPFGFDEADGKTSESRDVFWSIARADTATVFIEVPIKDIVAAVFDTPMVAANGKELLSVCFTGLSAGDAIGDVAGGFSLSFFQ